MSLFAIPQSLAGFVNCSIAKFYISGLYECLLPQGLTPSELSEKFHTTSQLKYREASEHSSSFEQITEEVDFGFDRL